MTTTKDTAARPDAARALRVLMIDDEEALLVPMARYFERLGCRVTTAREREEAEALLEHHRFDLILLDLALTGYGLEGLDLLRNLRHGCTTTPVLILSGLIDPALEAEVLRQGANAVLAKPQHLNVLARTAMRLMGAGE